MPKKKKLLKSRTVTFEEPLPLPPTTVVYHQKQLAQKPVTCRKVKTINRKEYLKTGESCRQCVQFKTYSQRIHECCAESLVVPYLEEVNKRCMNGIEKAVD